MLAVRASARIDKQARIRDHQPVVMAIIDPIVAPAERPTARPGRQPTDASVRGDRGLPRDATALAGTA
ncbi:MAG TPA: hypothetical protein VNF04_09505 [Stellaceae bacterium]|nr:hypothetical protein [Stellaceae bacterium]